MDIDFFAAPPPPPQALTPPSAAPQYAPARAPIQQRKSPVAGSTIGWILGAVLLLGGVAATVATMSGLARHDAKNLDGRSLAYDATTKSDLAQTAVKEQTYFAEKGQYGGAQEIGASVLPGSSGTAITVMYDDKSFCLQGAHLGTKNVYYYSSAAGLLPLGQTCS